MLHQRLGNQLHQVAFGRWLSMNGLPVRYEAHDDITDLLALFPRLPLVYTKGPRRQDVVEDFHAVNAVIPLHATRQPTWWHGFWQRMSYTETLVSELRLQEPALNVLMHVRQDDVADTPIACTPDYYAAAADPLGSFVDIVTDDVAWCRHHLALKHTALIRRGSPLHDLALLANATTVITSRSTFSWWGAFLNGGQVIAPDPWFTEASGSVGYDDAVIPRHWHRVPSDVMLNA